MMRLRELLVKHEGIKLKPYEDSLGKLTIGVGRNLKEVGISEAEAYFLLRNDMMRVEQEAIDHFPFFKSMSVARQDAFLDMLFNLGLTKILKFENMLLALQSGNFTEAAKEMRNSRWAAQVGDRDEELARIMESGFYV